MVNQEHRIVTQLEVDGVIYCELRSIDRLVLFQNGSEGEKEERVLVHTRSIGDKRYTVKTIVSEAEGSENEETEEECNMTCLEVAAFEEDWNKNWNPSLGQEYTDSENEATEEELNMACLEESFKKVLRSGRCYADTSAAGGASTSSSFGNFTMPSGSTPSRGAAGGGSNPGGGFSITSNDLAQALALAGTNIYFDY